MNNIVVIKCGGSTIDQLSAGFFDSLKALKEMGTFPVIVHGGGPAIKAMLTKLNIKSEFVNGLRRTDEQVMEVVEMVLSGKVNKSLVRKAGNAGMDAVGLSGCDSRLIEAVPRDLEKLGFVGEVARVNTGLLFGLIERGIVPVIAPVGIGKDEHCYNINADTAAGALAAELDATKLLFVTDVPGILQDGGLLKTVTKQEVRNMIDDGTIYGGMIPKVEAAITSLKGNLKEVMIVDGKDTTMVKDGEIVGTVIKKNLEVVS